MNKIIKKGGSSVISRRSFVTLSALGALAVMGLGSGCSANDENVLSVGVKIDVPKFGYQNPATGEIEGFEVDIAHELANRFYGDPDALEVTGVNVTTRGTMLDTGVLDATLATFTITEARKKSYNFTDPYYQDYIGMLVKKESPVHEFTDLDGMTIGVAQAATTREKLQELADEEGITLSFNEYATYPELKIALVSGRVDAFSVDSSILQGYVDEGTRLLDTDLGKQDYGIATSKADPDFSAAVNQHVNDMMDDGTLDALKEKWELSD